MAPAYYLTPLARDQLRAIRDESRARFGADRTALYFRALHEAMLFAAANLAGLRERVELAGVSGLMLHHSGRHYFAFKPIGPSAIIVGAILHDRMDVLARLSDLRRMTRSQIDAMRDHIAAGRIGPAKPP